MTDAFQLPQGFSVDFPEPKTTPAQEEPPPGFVLDGEDIVKRGELLPLGRTRDPEAGIMGTGIDFAVPGFLVPAQQAVADLLSGRRQARDITGDEILSLSAFAGPGVAARAGAVPAGQIAAEAVEQGAGTVARAGAAAAETAGPAVMRKFRDFFPTIDLPETAALRERATSAYQRAEEAGVVLKPEKFGNLVGQTVAAANKAGFDPLIQKNSGVLLKRMQDALNQPIGLQRLDNLRQLALGVAKGNDPNDARIAGVIIGKIDEMLDGVKTGDLLTGGEQGRFGIAALKEGRRFWKAFRKAEVLDDLFDRAQTSAPNFSGSGMENALRTEFRALAKNKKRMKPFSAREQAAIKRVARGGPIENLMRQFGKFAPTGVVSTALSGGAGAAAAEALGLPGAAGAIGLLTLGGAARRTAEGFTQRNVNRANQLVRNPPLVEGAPSINRFTGAQQR